MRDFKTRLQFFLGTAALAAWGIARHYLDRPGRSNDWTDFALGVMFGVGTGFLILVAWRSGRHKPA